MTQTKIKQSSNQAIKQPNNQTIDIETVAVLVAAVVEVAEGVPTAQVACRVQYYRDPCDQIWGTSTICQ